jgi:hypothetical protein
MQDKVWQCKDGRLLVVSQMDTSHINNCIRLIQKSGGTWRAEYLERLQIELLIRSMQS